MAKDKVLLEPNELPNLVSFSRLDGRNYLQWAQYIRTTLKGCKKLSHVEGNDLPRDDQSLKHILGKEKLPSLSEVFFIVRSEETRLSIMLDKGNSNTRFAMVIGKGPTKRSTFEGKLFTKSSHGEYCTYCKRPGHTKDTCYRLYGKEKLDNGTKFVNLEFSKFLKDNGVGESYREVEPIIKSLPFLTQDVQVQVQKVTKSTLVLEQVQMSEPDVSIPHSSIEEQVQLSKLENLQQFDVKIVFLHGDLEEEVYKEIPRGFYSHNEKNKYVLDLIINEIGKLGCKTSGVSIEQNHMIGEESPIIEKSQYQRLVGKLIYLSHTRPDIAYVANYARSVVDRRSISKYCMFMGGNLVAWKSKKQNVVARSSAEVEFRVMTQGICEGLWIKIILDDIKVKYERPIKLFCDNNSTISIAYNSIQHDKTKHIEIDKHFIKEKLDSGLIVTTHVPTRLQMADVFTKGLPTIRFQEFSGKLGMIDIHLPT
ncbi:Copia protein, partial [Mucuna pruriens]